MPLDRRGLVFHTCALLSFLGVLLSTGWVIFWAGFTLDAEGPGPAMLRQESLAAAVGCALLVAAAVPLRVARAERWLVVVDAALAALLGAIAYYLVAGPAPGHDHGDDTGWQWVVHMFAVAPTTWPILVLLLATPLLRGRSAPGRRSAQDR